MHRFEEHLAGNSEGNEFFFNEAKYTFVDLYMVPHVERIFFMELTNKGVPGGEFLELDKLPRLRRWCEVMHSQDELKEAYSRKDMFVAIIEEFKQTGKWGLKLPLPKL